MPDNTVKALAPAVHGPSGVKARGTGNIQLPGGLLRMRGTRLRFR
jgi:hypothetical protein